MAVVVEADLVAVEEAVADADNVKYQRNVYQNNVCYEQTVYDIGSLTLRNVGDGAGHV